MQVKTESTFIISQFKRY